MENISLVHVQIFICTIVYMSWVSEIGYINYKVTSRGEERGYH